MQPPKPRDARRQRRWLHPAAASKEPGWSRNGQAARRENVLARIAGAGEIVGGSQREERLDVFDLQLKKMGLSEQLWWYRDLRRYGTVPHAGFGLGFERLLYYITGMGNVRDLIPFPRTPKSAPF